MTDAGGNVRARYAYDPYGRQTLVSGDVSADFGFAGMFWSSEASLSLTRFRAYDPNLGRWLSRDPLENAELSEGPNLYAYVRNDPVNLVDLSGKSWGPFWQIVTSVENSGAAPFGPGAATSTAAAEEEEVLTLMNPSEETLLQLATKLPNAGGLVGNLGVVGGGTVRSAGFLGTGCTPAVVAASAVISLAAGAAFGYFVLDSKYHVDEQGADAGVDAEHWAEKVGFSENTSDEIGIYVTLQTSTNPLIWVYDIF